MSVELLLDARAELGESPAWNAKTQTLYWVDILKKQLHIFRRQDRIIQLDDYVSCVAHCKNGRLILAMRRGFWTIDPDDVKSLIELAVPAREPSTNRFNDGKCDPAGRLLAGTMDMAERATVGSLYSLSLAGQIRKLLAGIHISNGLAWSPDYKTLFYIDTPTRCVKAFDYDLATGSIADPRLAMLIPAELG
jgi:sugar lactone lactonase YvrE